MNKLTNPFSRDGEGNYLFTPDSFELLRNIALRCAGIDIPKQKKITVYNRILPYIKFLKLPSIEAYCSLLVTNKKEEEKFINLITNSSTKFFREPQHFDFLASYLATLITKKNRIRFLSAGCATGEEAYSIALVAYEIAQNKPGINFSILATDINADCLDIAKKGIYELDKIKHLHFKYMKQFYRGINENSGLVKVKNNIQKLVTFRRHNLIEGFSDEEPFDIIFCRNVTIYFSREMARRVLNQLDNSLVPEGIIILGHSENILQLRHRYKT